MWNRCARANKNGYPAQYSTCPIKQRQGFVEDMATTTVKEPSDSYLRAVSTIILPPKGCWYEYTTKGLFLGRPTSSNGRRQISHCVFYDEQRIVRRILRCFPLYDTVHSRFEPVPFWNELKHVDFHHVSRLFPIHRAFRPFA